MIIVRSERAFNHPPTSTGSDPVTIVATGPMGNGKYSGSQDRKATFNVQNSMGFSVNLKTESGGQV